MNRLLASDATTAVCAVIIAAVCLGIIASWIIS